jgi:serine O-acetyltransferase
LGLEPVEGRPDGFWKKLSQDLNKWEMRLDRPAGFLLLLHHLIIHPGFQLVVAIRTQEVICRIPIIGPFIARLQWYLIYVYFGCDIGMRASIAGGLHIPHPVGIVIGAHARIGRNVTIYQNVTIGQKRIGKPAMPTIGDGVTIYSGAVIAGEVHVGRESLIGANTIVTSDVPPDSIVSAPPNLVRSKPNEASSNSDRPRIAKIGP